MITEITLHNFQAHKKSKLSLAPGVNAIVGQSDSGKSSILRALRWVVENQPSGDAFRSHWGGDTEVRIDDVQRVRTKKANGYIHGEQEYVALGVGKVPAEIAAHLNLDPGINLQAQHDAPFLLFDSPGDVARTLNECVNLEVIDEVLSRINGLSRSCSNDLKYQETATVDLGKRLAGYDALDVVKGEAETLLQLEKATGAMAQKASGLLKLAGEITLLVEKKEKADKVADIKLTLLFATADNLDCDQRKLKDLQTIVKRLQSLKTQVVDVGDLDGLGERQAAWAEKIAALADTKKLMFSMRGIITEHDRLTSALQRLQGEVNRAEQEFTRLMPDECPLCGRSG